MDYRNERDALRGRVENLEQELDEARGATSGDKAARVAQLERHLAEAQGVMEAVRRELAEVKAPREAPPRPANQRRPELGRGVSDLKVASPQRSQATAVVVIAATFGCAAIVAAASASGVLTRSDPTARPVARAYQPIKPTPRPVEPAQTSEAPPPVAPPPIEATTTTTPVPKPTRIHGTWSASVTRATGSAPPVGSMCTVDAVMEGAGGKIDIIDLAITCRGTELYRAADHLRCLGTHQVTEQPGPVPGKLVCAIQYEDMGTCTAHQIDVSLDSTERMGSVWRTSVPSFHVDFSMSKLSAPTKHESLDDRTEDFYP